jgi:hypothetical protein
MESTDGEVVPQVAEDPVLAVEQAAEIDQRRGWSAVHVPAAEADRHVALRGERGQGRLHLEGLELRPGRALRPQVGADVERLVAVVGVDQPRRRRERGVDAAAGIAYLPGNDVEKTGLILGRHTCRFLC